MTGQYQPGQGFTATSPRQAMAQALLQQGASRAPVSSPLEGIARMLQAGVGGWLGGQERQAQKDALAEALKALEDPSVPESGRAKAAYAAYAAKNPDAPNPFEATMLAQAVPKERFVEVKNDKGQVIGQRSTLSGKLEPFKLDSISPGQKSLNLFGEVVADGGVKLPDGMVQNPDGSISTVPNFTNALKEIKQAEAGGSAQGKADVDLVMNPRIIAGETPAKAAQAGAVTGAQEAAALPYVAPKAAAQQSGSIQGQLAPVPTAEGPRPGVQVLQERTQVGQRQGQNAVTVAPPGFRMEEDQMVAVPGGPEDPATIRSAAAARESGTQDGQGGKSANEASRKWREELKKPVEQAADLVNQRNIIRTSLSRADGTGDIAAIVGFNKLLDPGAVVREADVALTLQAQSLSDRLKIWMDNKREGDILPPELRAKMGALADQIYKTSADTIKSRVLPFKGVMEKQGVSFDDVMPAGLQEGLGWIDAKPTDPTQTAAPQLPTISNDAAGRQAFDKLRPGDPYIGPDGKPYIKPLGASK